MKAVRLTIAVMLICLVAASAHARRKARIADLRAFIEGQIVYASFRVENAFTERMEEAINSGIPSTFTYRILLIEKGSGIGTRKVVNRIIKRTITYDTINKRYFVTLREGADPVAAKDFEDAKRLMTTVDRIAIAPTSWLLPNATHRLRIKAELEKIKLPFYLHYLFIFVSLWDFETDWAEVEVR